MAIKKILVVDDSKTELHYLSELLDEARLQVVTAENGEDAIARRQGDERPT